MPSSAFASRKKILIASSALALTLSTLVLFFMAPLNITIVNPGGLSFGTRHRRPHIKHQDIPFIVIWSWEHDDDLSYIDTSKVAVAYYAGTIMLGRDTASLHPRKNSIHLAPATISFPAFRMESGHPDEATSDEAFRQAAEIIAAYIKDKHAETVQIDFDATERDRNGYLHFLQKLHDLLPPSENISITALASWCLYDKWLKAAPVVETVAMMFSMGAGKEEVLQALEKMPLRSGIHQCNSIGISINEPATNARLAQAKCLTRASRIYVFSSTGWSKDRYESVMKALKQI